MSIIPSAAPNDTTTTVPDEDSHEAAVARYLSTPYTDDATPAPMTPDSVRTDALQPGDQIRHPHDWTLFTVGAAAERLDDLGSPLDFRNRETDEFERGMRVTGTDASGETVHVDTAPSYLWHREGQQKTARDKLATAVAEHGPFPMPTGDTVPALTEAALEAKVYDSLVSFNGVACWDILRLAQMRQYLAEHVAADLVPELDRLRTQVAELEADLADATEPDVDGAGRTCEEYYPVPAPRDLRPGADAARRTIRDRQVAEGSRAPRQVAPVEAFAYDMDQALVDLSADERRGADLVLQVLRARATAADVPTAEDAS